MTKAAKKADAQNLVIVTGPSGAGRATAIHVLEDLGYEAIDNLPMRLIPRLLSGPPVGGPLALGVDTRNRDFSVVGLIEVIDRFEGDPAVSLEVLYLDCSEDVLLRRFSETRRRHPLAPAESPRDGVAREIDLLIPIRARATILIDTSELGPHDLKAELTRWFAPGDGQRLAISVHSFSYRRGMPRGIDMVFDCRFLKNPYWETGLRSLDGTRPEVFAYVAGDPLFGDFFGHVHGLTRLLLPAFIDEGKSHFSIGFGCTGGQHRSVVVAEKLAEALAEEDWQVSIRHRELERRATTTARQTSG